MFLEIAKVWIFALKEGKKNDFYYSKMSDSTLSYGCC